MLNIDRVVELERECRDETVLTVYVGGGLSNPADRNRWKLLLRNNLEAAAGSSAALSADGKSAFEKAAALLRENMPTDAEVHAAGGWLGVFSAEGTVFSGTVPVHMPDVVAWQVGARVAPVLRALKEAVPVITAIADGQSVALYHYAGGEIGLLETLESEAEVGEVLHMGDAPRAGFHAGVRGQTGADQADRVLRAAREKLYAEAADRVARNAGLHGWILVGGTPEACAAMENLLRERARGRMLSRTSLHKRSSLSDLAHASAETASALRRIKDLHELETITNLAAAGGKGATGVDEVKKALGHSSVQQLYLSASLIEKEPEAADAAVRLALQQAAEIEIASGEAAEWLDEKCGSIAARLRFVPDAAISA